MRSPSRHEPSHRDLQAICVGKQRFESPGLAHSVAKRRKHTRGSQDVYRCPSCGGWHHGNPEGRR